MERDLLKSFAGRVLSSITGTELLFHTEKFAPSPASFNGLTRLVSAFWRWSAKHPRDWCDAKRVEVLERKETTKDEIGILNAKQCHKLLETAKKHYPECVPGFAISLFTGMRKAELTRLEASDVTSSGINLPATSTKTGRRRFIQMPTPLKAWLKAYPLEETVLPANWHKKEKAVRRLAGWKVWSDLVEPHVPPKALPEWPHIALRHTHTSVLIALGNRKYQNEGGPGAREIAELLRDQSTSPANDVQAFAEALIFNWLIAGTDAHPKNFSLHIAPGSQVRLAPLYDLASMLPYPRRIDLQKAKLAMKIGSGYRLREIRRSHWEACARDLRMPATVLIERAESMIAHRIDAAPKVADMLMDEGLDDPVIGRLVDLIDARARSCRERLADALA